MPDSIFPKTPAQLNPVVANLSPLSNTSVVGDKTSTLYDVMLITNKTGL
jgi:hypothetical protein